MDEEQTGMTNCYGLPEEDLKRIIAIFAANKAVEQLVLFGSRAKGNYKSGSDIDLVVYGASITHHHLLDLYSSLEELGLLYRFDLIRYNSIKDKDVISHIDRVGIKIYCR